MSKRMVVNFLAVAIIALGSMGLSTAATHPQPLLKKASCSGGGKHCNCPHYCWSRANDCGCM